LETLDLKLTDGVTLAVPARLDSITTYVLLEQEAWFEKEASFLTAWLQPGMTAIDIGANLGVYSLPMARLVGSRGQVFAYEPGSEPRGFLQRSRELNRPCNLEIAASALSDGEREGYLVFGESSEVSALGQGGRGEPVRVTSLDAEDRNPRWGSPDFVKIDAEGEEERIIAGGRAFFSRYSPLIMFEVNSGAGINEGLLSSFRNIGYELYRALVGVPLLVPIEADDLLDSAELNLFAAKPDRAESLSREGFLIQRIPAWEPDQDALRDAFVPLRHTAFAPAFSRLFHGAAALDPEYHQSLAGFAVWSARGGLPHTRCAALRFAYHSLSALSERAPSAARLATFARVAWHWGQRTECIKALRALLELSQGERFQVAEPFWPPCPRFDAVAPEQQAEIWFVASAAEQFERASSFSSCFSGATPVIEWLCSQPFASAEMERRSVLTAARAGRRPTTPKRLELEAPDNLNADLWRGGKVPGVLAPAS
jgi:FkbM family methyltransferase